MRRFSFFSKERRKRLRTPRERLQNTMPGETGALAALRLGLLIG